MDEKGAPTITPSVAREITAGIRVKEKGKLRKLTDHEALSLTKEAWYWARITYRADREPLVRHIREALETAHRKLRDSCAALAGLDEHARLFIVGDDEEQFTRLVAPVRELERRLEDAIKDAQQHAEDTGRASGGQPRDESIYRFVAALLERYERITNRRPGQTVDDTTGLPDGPFGHYLCRSFEAFWPSKAIPSGSVRNAFLYSLSCETEFDPEWAEETLPEPPKGT